MLKVRLIALLTVIIAGWLLAAQADKPARDLVRVDPIYQEAAYSPETETRRVDPDPSPPSPSDQMYVFWILGKILSYPVDSAESLITKMVYSRQEKATPKRVSATSQPNPFNSEHLREIPPAPPALEDKASTKD